MKKILVATRNSGKAREFGDMLAKLNIPAATLADWPDLAEPEETGGTFGENAQLKAVYYAKATGEACLADDSGLEVAALGGAPGVYSARYAGVGADDAANNRLLLANMERQEERACRFFCALALADKAGRVVFTAEGAIAGELLRAERGAGGFGYDPLFFSPELGKTLAEASAEEKNAVSHRARALAAMLAFLGRERC